MKMRLGIMSARRHAIDRSPFRLPSKITASRAQRHGFSTTRVAFQRDSRS
jgi:hypothetical protein